MKNMAPWQLMVLTAGLVMATRWVSWPVVAQDQTPAASPKEAAFATPVIDIGMCVSDIEASVKFYTQVVGFKELEGFSVPGDYGKEVGLSDGHQLDVKVLAQGDEPNATKLKLIQFPKAPGSRIDQSFIHSSYGIRYFTVHVKNVNEAYERVKKAGVKPVGKSPLPLPSGLPEGMGLLNVRDPDGNLVELLGPYTPQ